MSLIKFQMPNGWAKRVESMSKSRSTSRGQSGSKGHGPGARMLGVQSPVIPIVADWIRQHPGTISLGQGVVSYGPPSSSHAEVERFFREPDAHKYKAVGGLPELAVLVGEKLDRENGIQTGMGTGVSMVVTAGGNMAFMNAVLAVTDPGDEVILQTPYYFNHEMAVTIAGCRPVLVPTDANYQLQPARVADAIGPRTRAVVTVSPNNPTGAVYGGAALRAVNELCGDKGIFHIHDEAYEYFTWDGARHFSPGSIPGAGGHTISLYSLSKAYGFASWRIGYMTMPEVLLESVRKIQDTILICPPVVCQYAAMGALRDGVAYCRERMAGMARTRALVLEELRESDGLWEVPVTAGAFYFLVRVAGWSDPVDLTRRLIEGHGVAVIPGTAFGLDRGCHLRVAYGALEPETAREGIGRLVSGLKALLKSNLRPGP